MTPEEASARDAFAEQLAPPEDYGPGYYCQPGDPLDYPTETSRWQVHMSAGQLGWAIRQLHAFREDVALVPAGFELLEVNSRPGSGEFFAIFGPRKREA